MGGDGGRGLAAHLARPRRMSVCSTRFALRLHAWPSQEGFEEVSSSFRAHGMNDLGEYGLFASESAGFHGVSDIGLQAPPAQLRKHPSLLPPWIAHDRSAGAVHVCVCLNMFVCVCVRV